MQRVLVVFGTRPEAIKLAPLIQQFRASDGIFETKVCITSQHREMLDQVLTFFDISPNYDLNLMSNNQTLFDFASDGLRSLQDILAHWGPDVIFVQGDTTTAFIGALAGFYKRIKVAHVEAGLRSKNKYSPFPEEMNRVLAGHLADYHFAPTKRAMDNLALEGITKNVWMVGNTGIDALYMGLHIIKDKDERHYQNFFDFLDFSRRIILVTGHRRESFGKPFESICNALKAIAGSFDDTSIVYPVHLNPNVMNPVRRLLSGLRNVHLVNPIEYPYFIWLMDKSYLVLTDSGGIQEEAPSLGKPVLVMRDVTERPEGIEAGIARLVGSDKKKILDQVSKLLTDKYEYEKMAKSVNPYGDGKASDRIVRILTNESIISGT